MAKRKKRPGHRLIPFSGKAAKATAKKRDDATGAWNELRKLPTLALISTLNTMVEILQERGVAIRDWDQKDKVVRKVRMIGGKAYILAPSEKPHSEESTHGKDGESEQGG